MVDIDTIVTPAELAGAVQKLIIDKGLTVDAIQAAAGVGRGTLHDFVKGRTDLARWSTLEKILRKACGVTDVELAAWKHAYQRASVPGIGVPLTAELNPLDLGVHKVMTLDDNIAGAAEALTVYIPRPHDARLADVAANAADDASAMVVLVADSSTGKTRALWETLEPLRELGRWRLWHPRSPNRRAALLAGLDRVRPHTVVWLNETQEYLGGDNRPGDEEIAVALHDLLRDRARAPVLIVGTLWRQFYTALRASHASQARDLLAAATVLDVPSSFSGADPALLAAAAARDPRLRLARERAEDGRLTQYLAGGPEQVHRYEFELSAAAKAIVEVAMDARRMGHDEAIPHALLETAAYAYMNDSDWHRAAADSDWFERALAETARPCNGADGPLTRIQPPPLRSRTDRTAARSANRDAAAGTAAGPVYRLADYLDQYGRTHRREQIPPIRFWESAAAHASSRSLNFLGIRARDRGLLRDAAQLWKNAARQDLDATRHLINLFKTLDLPTTQPSAWAIDSAPLDDPGKVAELLDVLHKAGLTEPLHTLAERAAADTPLDDPSGAGSLLGVLREAALIGPLHTVAERAATDTSLDNQYRVGQLLDVLREAGLTGPLSTLAERVATDIPLDDWAGRLLGVLREAGLTGPLSTLAERAAADTPLDNPHTVGQLLGVLREAGLTGPLHTLAERVATDTPLYDPYGVNILLDALCEAGLTGPLHTLAGRAAADTSLGKVGRLLGRLREAGLTEPLSALAERVAADTPLDNLRRVLWLLDGLREAGLTEPLSAFAEHVATDTSLDCHPYRASELLYTLRQTGLTEPLRTLAGRAAAHTPLDDPRGTAKLMRTLWMSGLTGPLRIVAERAAADTPLDDPSGTAELLHALWRTGLTEPLRTVAERAAADTPVAFDYLYNSVEPLCTLLRAGLAGPFSALAERAATDTPLTNPSLAAGLLAALWTTGLTGPFHTVAERAATETALGNPSDAAELLDRLREAGLTGPFHTVLGRLPAAGLFDLYLDNVSDRAVFRFGREPEPAGSAAAEWSWEDLA